jgi:hypothetical protein
MERAGTLNCEVNSDRIATEYVFLCAPCCPQPNSHNAFHQPDRSVIASEKEIISIFKQPKEKEIISIFKQPSSFSMFS